MKLTLNNEVATQAFAQKLARCVNETVVIYLAGELGSGKTTLARGFIQFFGFERVKSPTYTLVESYQNTTVCIHHFDLYRLSNPEELDYIGIRDYQGIQLIEWADLGIGMINKADMVIKISGNDNTRMLEISTHSQTGNALKKCLNS